MRFPKVTISLIHIPSWDTYMLVPRKSIFIDSRGRFDIQWLKVESMLVQALVNCLDTFHIINLFVHLTRNKGY